MSGMEVLLVQQSNIVFDAALDDVRTEVEGEAENDLQVQSSCGSVANYVENGNSDHVPSDDTDDSPPRKKRKTRRGKRKYKPYHKLSWSEKRKLEDKEAKRATRVRDERFANGQAGAPYNTTQFLMDDHNSVPELENQLQVTEHFAGGELPQLRRKSRARDSSFSLESEEEFFYSSPEDEEEFLTKEFSNIYESVHAERLSSMNKNELIQEYMQLEDRVDNLENKLKEVHAREREKQGSGESDYDISKGEMPMEPETAEKIRIFQQEIAKLMEENHHLRSQNESLRRKSCSSTSTDSDSDSTTSSTSCSTSCSTCSDSDSDRVSVKCEPSAKNGSAQGESVVTGVNHQSVKDLNLVLCSAANKYRGSGSTEDNFSTDSGYAASDTNKVVSSDTMKSVAPGFENAEDTETESGLAPSTCVESLQSSGEISISVAKDLSAVTYEEVSETEDIKKKVEDVVISESIVTSTSE